MLGGFTLEERVDLDFVRARRREFVGRILGREGARDFEEVRRSLGVYSLRRLGRRSVKTTRIVGSVGRVREFGGGFMPAHRRLREKWVEVDRRMLRGEELRPVTLYRVGEDYYVEDGNHRVSVARFHGVEMLDAEVIELLPARGGRLKGEGKRVEGTEVA